MAMTRGCFLTNPGCLFFISLVILPVIIYSYKTDKNGIDLVRTFHDTIYTHDGYIEDVKVSTKEDVHLIVNNDTIFLTSPYEAVPVLHLTYDRHLYQGLVETNDEYRFKPIGNLEYILPLKKVRKFKSEELSSNEFFNPYNRSFLSLQSPSDYKNGIVNDTAIISLGEYSGYLGSYLDE